LLLQNKKHNLPYDKSYVNQEVGNGHQWILGIFFPLLLAISILMKIWKLSPFSSLIILFCCAMELQITTKLVAKSSIYPWLGHAPPLPVLHGRIQIHGGCSLNDGAKVVLLVVVWRAASSS
jgi:hypothetical protein